MSPIDRDIQLSLMIANGDFEGAAARAASLNIRSTRTGRVRRERRRAIKAVLRAAARVPAARPVALEIYRRYHPVLTDEERLFLRCTLGEDADVLTVDEEDIVGSVTFEHVVTDEDIVGETLVVTDEEYLMLDSDLLHEIFDDETDDLDDFLDGMETNPAIGF